MSYESFYKGNYSSLEPAYNNVTIGYQIPAGEFATTTDARTANQLQEVSNKLNIGGKNIEISGLDLHGSVFDAIPKEQFKELNRLAKLTGADFSLHGAIIEPSGYGRGGWSETSQKEAERKMLSILERAKQLNDKGNVPVTFHSSAVQLPEGEEKVFEGGEEKIKSLILVDAQTGEPIQRKHEKKYFPEEIPQEYQEAFKRGEFIPQLEVENFNRQIREGKLANPNIHTLRAKEIIEHAFKIFEKEKQGIEDEGNTEGKLMKLYAHEKKEEIMNMFPDLKNSVVNNIFSELDHGHLFLRDSYNEIRKLYNQVYENADSEDKRKLDDYKKKIAPLVEGGIENNKEKIREFAGLIEEGINVLGQVKNPKFFVPLNEFLLDKSSKTFGNVAFEAYKQFGDKAPVICIENPPAGAPFSRGEELKSLVKESRKKFVDEAKRQGYSEGDAKRAAEKLIGATWDVGHINLLRKQGYGDKELVKQTEKIARFVKHVHLSDNFGMEHTELPMGMGNVPIKEMMEKIGKEGFEGKKVIEAFDWWQHFKTPPNVPTFEAFGSPLYMTKAPYWNQVAGTYGNYFQMPSANFPEQHFSLYGGGFSSLPAELGGQIPGRGTRTAGVPMD